MDIKKQIQSCISQAEVYSSQGLLREGLEKYVQAGKLIKTNERLITNSQRLLVSLSKKIKSLKEEIVRIENAPVSMEMPQQVQEVIKQKFAFAKNPERAPMEGAIALAKFGQYERALEEFKTLFQEQSSRLEAAKNIIRCHLALNSQQDAVKVYHHWLKKNLLSDSDLQNIHAFIQKKIEKTSCQIELLSPSSPQPEPGGVVEFETEPKAEDMASAPPESLSDEEIIDISSVGIVLNSGPNKGRPVEYDVSFQSGSILNLLIHNRDKEMLDTIQIGQQLDPVQFYSPIAMFQGKAIVTAKSLIESGPKKGDWSVDIQIQSM